MTDLGTYIELDGRPAVRFARTYAHPIEQVWAAVTTAEGLARWFPAAVDIDLRPGGVVTYRANAEDSTGLILATDPPHYLSMTWGGNELRFHLEPLGAAQCRFTLIDLLDARDAAARNAAGWDVCLGELDKHLAGDATDGPHSASARPWRPCYEAYVAAGLPSGAHIPGGSDTSP